MSDDLSSFSDVEADQKKLTDQLLRARDQVSVCVEKLDAVQYTQALSDELTNELSKLSISLSTLERGRLFIAELISANRYVALHIDHRNVEVLRYGLLCLEVYLIDSAKSKTDQSMLLFSGFNELAALRGQPLLGESVLSLPQAYQVEFEALRNFDLAAPQGKDFNAAESYLEFSQLVLSIYRGEKRTEKIRQLSAYFEQLSALSVVNRAQSFWLLCAAYTQTVNVTTGELRPAVFRIFKQFENVVMSIFADDQAPVLGIQKSVDRLVSNLLFSIYGDEYQGAHVNSIEAGFNFSQALHLFSSNRPAQTNNIWLQESVSALWLQLQNKATQLSENKLSEDNLKEFLSTIKNLKACMVIIGVPAQDDMQEIVDYLSKSMDETSMQSCLTSIRLVEQQMMHQFSFLAADSNPVVESESNSVVIKQVPEILPAAATNSADFGDRCNSCIDVIQQSLDTALGSSGNLTPDNSVISALNNLTSIVAEHEITELSSLLEPLAEFLSQSENSTLNQSETLLVQEAIIAATLGIDSLVSSKPMPELVVDVAARIKDASSESDQGVRHSGDESYDSFISESEELVPRLFELFQRWRGAPFASNRLHGDISRLLHALKSSAEYVDEKTIASVVHYLESTMLDLRFDNTPPSKSFFDLAIEVVEWLGDDIERLRNNEASVDSTDLIDRLRIAGAVDEHDYESTARITATENNNVESEPVTDTSRPQEEDLVTVDFEQAATSIDWNKRLDKVDRCFDAIVQSNDRLIELQQKLDAAVLNLSQNNESDSSHKALQLQSLVQDLATVSKTHSSTIGKLGSQLNTESKVEPETLRGLLVEAITEAAKEQDQRLHFNFQQDDVKLRRDMASGLYAAIAPMLKSIIAQTTESISERTAANKPEVPSVDLMVGQSESSVSVQIAFDGSGVTVHGAEVRSSNPWQQTAKANFDEVRGTDLPSVWSNLNDTPIDVNALFEFSVQHGATVAITGDDRGSVYRINVPRLSSTQHVLVVEVQQQQFAFPANAVSNISIWNGEKALSIVDLLGIKKKSAFAKDASYHRLQCVTSTGKVDLLVDRVVGHQALEFASANRLLPDVPGYLGASVTGADQLIMLLDIDYWVTHH